VATSGLKFLADFLNITLPFSSALYPLINEKSPVIDLSKIYSLPSYTFLSFFSETIGFSLDILIGNPPSSMIVP
jgi:hypothetical protein